MLRSTADTVVDISHESLIRGWRRMRDWVEEEAESATVYRRLADTAALHAQGIAGLLDDPYLEHVLNWRDKERPTSELGASATIPALSRRWPFWSRAALRAKPNSGSGSPPGGACNCATSAATASITIVAVIALWQWHKATTESDRAKQALTATSQIADFAGVRGWAGSPAQRHPGRDAQ